MFGCERLLRILYYAGLLKNEILMLKKGIPFKGCGMRGNVTAICAQFVIRYLMPILM